MEPKGTGVNKFTYWVASSTVGEWTKLPDLEPKDIKASRTIKILFTGNTKREIFTNPFFFGKEEIYLRAQIARISFSTQLCPKTAFKFSNPEEEPRAIEPDLDEESGAPRVQVTAKQMCKADMWVHESVSILDQARTEHIIPEKTDDEIDQEVWDAM